jgi:hypothetical protein
MRNRPPWQYVALGAIGVTALLGFTGNLTSVTPLDRLLNPDARQYWESEERYLESIFEQCSNQSDSVYEATDDDDRALRSFERCFDSSVDTALDRGYLSDRAVREFEP